MENVIFQCVKDRSKMRIRILSQGYYHDANCQFPRDIREVGCYYSAPANRVRLVTARGKYYYSVSKGDVEVLGDVPNKKLLEQTIAGGHGRTAPAKAKGSSSSSSTAVDPKNITVFEDDRSDECCICMACEKNTVFNCGHLYTCQECSFAIRDCPICRQKITLRIPKAQFA